MQQMQERPASLSTPLQTANTYRPGGPVAAFGISFPVLLAALALAAGVPEGLAAATGAVGLAAAVWTWPRSLLPTPET